VSWEGYAVTVALVLGMGLLKWVDDPVRRAIALALLVAAYGAVVFLTWSNDPD
jgi:peptidoglycan/LPS O-acetylase OafA/YrhL